ncbi:MAG: sugar ABC transporter permease [Spirochaetia bacterium]|nr:sugar ABC transporter permease [Spirochaetia bacterium]
MLGALLFIWIIFTIFTDGYFLKTRNISNLTRQMAIVGILGIGAVIVIITGNIDLSVGSVMGALGGLAAALHIWNGVGPYITIAIVLICGFFIGFYQGVIISYLKVPAFIVTLGGLLIFRGVLLGITKGISIAPFDDAYKVYGQAYIPQTIVWILAILSCLLLILINIRTRNSRLRYHFEVSGLVKFFFKNTISCVIILGVATILNDYRGLPLPVLIMLLLVLIFTFVAEKTSFGRSIYAMGGNREAAEYSGIKVRRNLVFVYALNGLLAAIAGIILSARLNAGTPSAGMNLELDAIAAAVIGGTSMSGGSGKVAGAILGAFFMATIDNGMSMMNVDAYWQYIVKGIILIVAVWFDVYSNEKGK